MTVTTTNSSPSEAYCKFWYYYCTVDSSLTNALAILVFIVLRELKMVHSAVFDVVAVDLSVSHEVWLYSSGRFKGRRGRTQDGVYAPGDMGEKLRMRGGSNDNHRRSTATRVYIFSTI